MTSPKAKYPRDGALVEGHEPAAPAPARDVGGARERVGALGVREEEVLDALSSPLDGLDHGLEVDVRGDEDGGVILVLEGAGEHVDGEIDVNTLFFEEADATNLPL